MALRTPDQFDGIPESTYDQQLKVQSSATMLSRVADAMIWLEPEVQSHISNVGVHCIMIAACAYNMDVDKAFSTSLASLRTLGTTCSHPKGTHQSIIGTEHPDGSFRSRDTAQYPFDLCDAFAAIVQAPFFKTLGRCTL